MKRNLNVIVRLFLAFVLLICTFTIEQATAKEKTLGDLKQELNKKIEEYQSNKEQQKATEEEIEKSKQKIYEIHLNIESNQKEIVKLEQAIIELNSQILEKEKEIKAAIKFYQISNGTDTYLEYIFGANSFTDLIYRLAVTEQLLDYNDKLVDEYNSMIESNENQKELLAEQVKKLETEQHDLEQELKKLGNRLNTFTDLSIDIQEEIDSQRAAIKIYEEQYNCKDSDKISVCTTSQLPEDTAFWRPIKQGYRTSEYGVRTYTLNGKKVTDFHTGLDMSTSPNSNVPIYASAAGIVISIVEKASCGGNKIYIHHKINGKTYTTSYNHLRKIMVSVGDVVTKDTQIGVMGGSPRIETWDKCSTGTHLHFAINNGLYLKDYSSWNSFVAHTINPRTIVNFPTGGTAWFDRTTKY